MEMEKPVRNVQAELPLKRIPKSASMSPRGLGADKDLSVLKGNYISRPGKVEKPAMQLRHPPIRHDDYAQFSQARQAAGLLRRNPKARSERTPCEFFQGN